MARRYFYVIAAATLWGAMCIFVTELKKLGFSTVQIALLRAFVSLIFIGSLILFRNRALFRIHLRDIWMFFGSGIVSYFLFNNCYFTAIGEVGAAVSSVLLYTSPIFVTIMSCILFGEKMTKKKVLCLLLAVIGCALVSGIASGEGGRISAKGIFFGLASGFTYALYSIFSTYALRKYQALTVTFYTFLFGAIAALIIGNPISTFKMVATPLGISWALALGIFSGALPYFLYTLGLAKMNPSHAAVMATIEPVVASVIGIFLYDNSRDIFTVLGIVLILLSSVILNIRFKKE